jgi:3-oxoacyl-[acyl-carrier protein] reductase
MQLKGAVAIIAGAGRLRGVGASTARLLAKKGCNVLINAINSEEQAQKVASECQTMGVDAAVFMADLTDANNCQTIASFVKDRWGRADIVVNTLGYTKGVPYEKLNLLTEADFSKIFAVNVTAPFLMAQAFQLLLKTSGDACIVNVSSAAGISGKGSSIAYAAAKGAENTLTLALAQALSPEVRVNAVCPSFIDSSWWDGVFSGKEDQYNQLLNTMKKNNLHQRVLVPDDVARTILQIIENPGMSGEIIRLDMGAHIGQANAR